MAKAPPQIDLKHRSTNARDKDGRRPPGTHAQSRADKPPGRAPAHADGGTHHGCSHQAGDGCQNPSAPRQCRHEIHAAQSHPTQPAEIPNCVPAHTPRRSPKAAEQNWRQQQQGMKQQAQRSSKFPKVLSSFLLFRSFVFRVLSQDQGLRIKPRIKHPRIKHH
jgi:hypothetical protein